jgi:WhiB family transcriptional regulator, redox-sensing transcriptional regulator
MQHERESVVADEVSLAQGMTDWFADYLYGTRAQIDTLPPLTAMRLRRQFGDGDSADHMALIRDNLMVFDDVHQYNIATYICGYPAAVLNVLATEDIEESLRLLDEKFPPPSTIRLPDTLPVHKHSVSVKQPVGVELVKRSVVLGLRSTPETNARTRQAASYRMPITADAISDPSDTSDLDWQQDALCPQTDPEAFFPEQGGSTRDAKKICAACEVRTECLDYALANDQRFGIWGGLSERERRKLRKRA